MTRTLIEIDDDALAAAALVLGTLTPSETVNAALREVAERRNRPCALERPGEMAEGGHFAPFVETAAHRP